MGAVTVPSPTVDVGRLDPYQFMALVGKRVIHPGGRRSTRELFDLGEFSSSQSVLDIGCGVGTSAIEIAERYACSVTAGDISELMLDRARANVSAAGLSDLVAVERADILALPYADGSFDRVIAEAVTMFVDRSSAASELLRVCKPGGRVLATEFYWKSPPTDEAKEVFLGQVCPGMEIESMEGWKTIYETAGLANVRVSSGPFEMMTARGFLSDEGIGRCLAIMAKVMTRPAYMRKMAWLMPRLQRAVPYLGYLVVAGTKPVGARA